MPLSSSFQLIALVRREAVEKLKSLVGCANLSTLVQEQVAPQRKKEKRLLSARSTVKVNGIFERCLKGGLDMSESIHLEVKAQDIIQAVRKMSKKERLAFLEDLLGATSPEYLESIREARADYKAGRVKEHAEVFDS
jgi:hypothetical protein